MYICIIIYEVEEDIQISAGFIATQDDEGREVEEGVEVI